MENNIDDKQAWRIIVGLGNPGKQYADNRHNVGFHVVDKLAEKYGLKFNKMLNRGIAAIGDIEGHRVVLLKPQTFMNESGVCVSPTFKFYKTDPSNLMIIYDELDIPFAQLRLRKSGSAGGHNGMRSIISKIVTQDFPRLRVGIGRPPGRKEAATHVLEDFTRDEVIAMRDVHDRAIAGIVLWLNEGIDKAMNKVNGSS
ncbi:MAG: aminoacyl-tRNA hydrolase [Chloroflexi bacterium]|jgi:PTH1 family peptidyl-tRNA hydrolase|nr:aminoacyl-tRNA hydrolase [Chloroflexota bacterium]